MRGEGEMDLEFGTNICKLLYIEQINKVLLGNYIRYPLISHNGKEYGQECMCVYMYVCVAQCSIVSASLRPREL